MVVIKMAENRGENSDKNLDSGGKYVRYTSDQIEVLERVYSECPKPTAARRQELAKEFPCLASVEPKQINIWFQNRRCREKQKSESARLQSSNLRLATLNKLLTEENNRLQKQVSLLTVKNGCMKQHMRIGTGTAVNGSCESVRISPPHVMTDDTNIEGLLKIAEETLNEFVSKATGTAVDWVQMPGMKRGPDSVGIYAISQSNGRVAARACSLVGLEPSKIVEILKDRLSWFRDCRSLEIFTSLPTENGGTIELVYTQMFAPTVLASARDLWTLRYTTSLENGSLVVCERSFSGSCAAPNVGDNFVRAEMLPSGYLIRPCDGGRSIIHIVDHLNLEPSSVPEVLRPLYISSNLIAEKMIMAALRYVRQIAHETNPEVCYEFGRHPAILRKFSERLSRGFNDGVSGFNDAGWLAMNIDGADDVTVLVNSTKNLMPPNSATNSSSMHVGILCAKASMLLRNVPPAVLVRFLREQRSEWADHNMDAYAAASMKTNSVAFFGMRPANFSGTQIVLPLGHTIENEEMLEIIRIEGHSLSPENAYISKGIHLLQMCNGIAEKSTRTCAELVFSPVNEELPDDAPLLPSGFRIVQLMSESEVDPVTPQSPPGVPAQEMRAVLTIAFQFPFESKLQNSIAAMARQYIRRVITSVQRIAVAVSPPEISKFSPETLTLAQWIASSYSYHFGQDLIIAESRAGPSVMRNIWHHSDAILCCSVKAHPTLIFANQAGLSMLETTLTALRDISLGRVFDDSCRKVLYSEVLKIMQLGSGRLPPGICKSTRGRRIKYSQSSAWKVRTGDEDRFHCLAFSFINWCFMGAQDSSSHT